MASIDDFENSLLLNFQNCADVSDIDCSFVNDLREGKFLEILQSSVCEEAFKTDEKSISHAVEQSLVETLDTLAENHAAQKCATVEKQLDFFAIGVASLEAFLQSNWTGPPFKEDSFCLPWLHSLYKETSLTDEQIRDQVTDSLILDGESCSYVKHPELLLLARIVLKVCAENFTFLMTVKWWWMRCLFTHQQILEEHSESLCSSLKSIIEGHIDHSSTQPAKRLMENKERSVLFHLESIRIHVYYSEVVPAKRLLEFVLDELKIKIDLMGLMGKRTRYQQKDIAQLVLRVKKEAPDNSSISCELPLSDDDLPPDIVLQDEVRLSQIEFCKEGNFEEMECQRLSPLELSAVVAQFALTQRSQPKDKLADEELLAYISNILYTRTSWTHHMFGLLVRSQLESNHRRTVERAMEQVQALVTSCSSPQPEINRRLHMLFCSHLPQRWSVETVLANLFVSLALTNSALVIYQRLHRWEDVIGCYNLLQLRHKAAEIIQQELGKKETVKLWCLLGDATDNVECYRKAWELSGERSARAQRHWGLYFFHRKQYAESIDYFRKSLNINSLQISLWFMLGFAAMDQEQWELCATAYRRYTNLDPDSFEAWNNLGKAYVNMGEKERAWSVFREAVKCNFDTWKVWDNFMVVSVDCCVYDEVIQAYHRLLDLKGKHVDERVLEILVMAIIRNLPDNNGQPSSLLRKKALELMGRITGQVTTNATLWRLYAELTASVEEQTPETLERTVQYLQRAHRAATQNTSWPTDSQLCLSVMKLCDQLFGSYMECCKKCPSPQHQLKLLNSVKFSLQGVISRVKKEYVDACNIEENNMDEQLSTKLAGLENNMEQVLNRISELQQSSTSSTAS